MKNNRILSTVGMCPTNSTRLRSYCSLMQASLHDKWLFADDFVQSHVCLVEDNYLVNWGTDKIHQSQVIVVVNVSGSNRYKHSDYEFQISSPLTAAKIKDVLNRISNRIEFTPINNTSLEPKRAVNIFKSAFTKIRKNFFRKKEIVTLETKQKNKQEFIAKLSRKIQKQETLPCKIVLLGSPGSGKTTAIQSASSGRALNSDVAASDSVAKYKAKTTVGIDYADITLTGLSTTKDPKIQLFGTPGQIKFNFVWDMVGKNANAFIILLDMSRPEPLSYLKFYIKFLKNELGKKSHIYCALTHSEKYAGDIPSIIDCIESEFSKLMGIYTIDARREEDVLIMLEDIYLHIEDCNSKPATHELKQINIA